MQHPDEGMIHAWIDGALTAEEAASLQAHAARCGECSAAIAEARGLVAASSRILLALDEVPRGVIPVATPKPRAWYARNDFRAAAAVLLVASASLVVVQGRQDMSPQMKDAAFLSMDTAGPISAEASASPSASDAASTVRPQARTTSVAPTQAMRKSEAEAADVDGAEVRSMGAAFDSASGSARGVSSGTAVATRMARKRQSVTVTEADFSGKGVAGGRASAADSGSARRSGSSQLQLDQVALTGVASESRKIAAEDAALVVAPLRIVRADTAQRLRTIVYEASKGIEVTLTEREQVDFSQKSILRGRVAGAAVQAPSAPFPAPPAPAIVPPRADPARTVMRAAPINTISWTDSVTGKAYTLTGALSPGELEALKVRIVEQRKHGFPPSRE